MWSQTNHDNAGTERASGPARDKLLVARDHMAKALTLLDIHSLSLSAASLDMAIHQLDRELSSC